MLGRSHRVATGGVHDNNSPFGGGGYFHVIHADTGPSHHLEPGGRFDDLGCNLGCTTDHETIIFADDLLELLRSQTDIDIYGEPWSPLEDLNTGDGQFVAN